MSICVPCACLVPLDTRKVLDPLGLLEMAVNNHVGGWKLNQGALEEQPFILTAESSPQPLFESA